MPETPPSPESEVPSQHESDADQWKRNFAELLQELRVVQTGNQILFAFLLTVAFSARFVETTALQRYVYVGTLVAATAGTAMIIAPVSHHRLLFRQGAKEQVVRMASRLAMYGLVCVMLALSGALFLAVDIVMGNTWASVITAGTILFHLIVWYVMPLHRKWRARLSEST
ncbi:DUF6328 family protein [Phytomonospora sp. NPDC050363]|uniref:DUF6328 family protein n=1 Tax=Phytomonospora sp. NPDC050363 TaxID=3155642 RepID=UPI00340D7E82